MSSFYDGVLFLKKELQELKFVKFCDSINNVDKIGNNLDAILIEIGDITSAEEGANRKSTFYRSMSIYHIGRHLKDKLEFLNKETDILKKVLDDKGWSANIQNVLFISSETSENNQLSELIGQISTGQDSDRYIHKYNFEINYCFSR